MLFERTQQQQSLYDSYMPQTMPSWCNCPCDNGKSKKFAQMSLTRGERRNIGKKNNQGKSTGRNQMVLEVDSLLDQCEQPKYIKHVKGHLQEPKGRRQLQKDVSSRGLGRRQKCSIKKKMESKTKGDSEVREQVISFNYSQLKLEQKRE